MEQQSIFFVVSFRRELFVAAGGPDGGDGGRGGDIIFEVDKGLNTLNDFRHLRKYIAQSGEDGKKRRSHGANIGFGIQHPGRNCWWRGVLSDI